MISMLADDPKNDDGRDLFARMGLEQADVILHICGFLTPKSITTLACVNQATQRLVDNDSTPMCHALWQQLWFRDYGRVLFTWDVAREAILKSVELLSAAAPTKNNNIGGLVSSALETKDSKEFYFRFQLAFVDYILAGHNQKTKCLMGLHGHIFDFTPFAPNHPGQSEPIVRECGRDVTDFFEDIRHSRGARRIASKLCLIVDRPSFLQESIDNDSPCGLYSPPRDVPNIISFLRQTKTKPPPEHAMEVSPLHKKTTSSHERKGFHMSTTTAEDFGEILDSA